MQSDYNHIEKYASNKHPEYKDVGIQIDIAYYL